MLTNVDRPIDPPEAHRQPVEHLPLPLYPPLGKRLVYNPEEEMGRQCGQCQRGPILDRKGGRADWASVDVRRGRRKH